MYISHQKMNYTHFFVTSKLYKKYIYEKTITQQENIIDNLSEVQAVLANL